MSLFTELTFSIWNALEKVIAVKLGVQPCFRGHSWVQVRNIKTLRKIAPVYASIRNRFNPERQLILRDAFKQNRSAACAERRVLAA